MKGYKNVGSFRYAKAAPNKNRRKTNQNFYNTSQAREEQKSELLKKHRQSQTLPSK
jgi:hypothetical protein